MTAERIDRLLLALGAVLILISSYQLFFRGFESDSGPKLGTLTSTLSIVKTKSAVALDWRDASEGLDVGENQLIYTDSASSAEVKFNEGNSLEIGENSLVKLKSLGNEQGMDVSKGFIRAKLEGNKALKVQMNGEDYLLTGKNADVQINIQESKGEIGVISGEVKLEAAGGVTENLNPENALEIEGDKITKKKISFKTLTPQKGASFYFDGAVTPVAFNWEPAEEASIKISKKRDLEKDAQVIPGQSGQIIDLGPGLYYYRIEGATGTSLINSFRVIKEVPPKILRPRNGEEVSLVNANITLQWMGEEKNKYQIEWNDGENPVQVARGIQHSSFNVDVKPGLPFAWRVRIDQEDRPNAVWSEWQNVSVSVIPVPKVPTDLIPHEVEYQTFEKPNEKIDLLWKGEGTFEVEIKDPAGASIVQKAAETNTSYTAVQTGKYAWRVRAVDTYLRSSEWTSWKTFSIEDMSGAGEEKGVQRIQLKKPDQAVTFNWKVEAGTVSVFELSKDSKFQTIVKKTEIKKDSIQVNVPQTGAYFWRSRQYRPDGSFEVSEPKRVIIEPVPAPEKPEKLPDVEIELDTLPATTTFIEHLFNFIIPSAHADESVGTVKITLPVKEEAKGYVVRIYRDENLKELVFEEELSNKDFEWINARPGVYYWQYAVIDYWDRKSLFSDPSHLTVKEETSLPEKPKMLSPIRAQEIDLKDLVLNWTDSSQNEKYEAEISADEDFKKVIARKTTKDNSLPFNEIKLDPKLYYWRVKAFNKKGKSAVSNTGRFTLLPSLEKTIIQDLPKEKIHIKNWKSRGFIAWSPSMDSYNFSDGESGTISGTAMMGAAISGTMFREKYAVNGEIIRQTGQVFEKEKYLFQRALVDYIHFMSKNPNHRWGLGAAVGQTSGFGYTIDDDSLVKSQSVSASSYGVTARNYVSINELWDFQGRFLYLLGDIATMEFGGEAIRAYKSYLLLGGVTYSSREYKVSAGKQTSIRFSFGFGKEF